MERFSDLRQKEVINICDGSRLGFVCDLEFDEKWGKIIALIIPADGKMWNFFCKTREYRVPWRCIKRIGDDIILVEVDPEEILMEGCDCC